MAYMPTQGIWFWPKKEVIKIPEKYVEIHEAIPRTGGFHEQAVGLLQKTPEENRARMQAILERTIAMALEKPVYQPFRDQLSGIKTLDDLTSSGFSVDSTLPSLEIERGKTWQQIVGTDDVEVVMTSGSSGKPKLIPYSKQGWEYVLWGVTPFFGQFCRDLTDQAKKVAFTLSSDPPYATYYGMPRVFSNEGFDVIHVPLSKLLRFPEAIDELADTIVEYGGIDTFLTIPQMAPTLMELIGNAKRGKEAVELIHERCKFVVFGGSIIQPVFEEYAREHFGNVFNMLGTTECMGLAGSDDISPVNNMYFGIHYAIPVIAPDGKPPYKLLTDAEPGTIGELLVTFPCTMPWINMGTDDYVKVVEQEGGRYTAPVFRMNARASERLRIGNANIHPQAFRNMMGALPGVNDFLVIGLTAQETEGLKDRLEIYIEGDEPLTNIEHTLYSLPVVGDNLNNKMFEAHIHRVPESMLRKQRLQKSAELSNAPGPLKDSIVSGQRGYSITDMIETHQIV